MVAGLGLVLSQAPAETVGYAAFVLAMTSMWPQVFESFGTYRVGAVSAVSVEQHGAARRVAGLLADLRHRHRQTTRSR